ncbi:MAG: phage tail protein [Verrucomicrobiales bacterium]
MRTTSISPVAIAAIIATSNALAAPALLPFQGHLTAADGTALDGGAKVVQFKIYDAPVSGTAVWAGEVHKLSVNDGLVNTVLGTKTAFQDTYGPANSKKVMFSEPLYIEITVDANDDNTITAADPPLLPRQVLLPANFAHVAHSVRNSSGEEVISSEGEIDGSKIAEDSIASASLGTVALAKLGDDGGNHAAGLSSAQIAEAAVGSSEIRNNTVSEVDLTPALRDRLDSGLIPPGTIVPFAGTEAKIPSGWLLCDGRAMDKDSSNGKYARLQSAIGHAWGDGSEGDGAIAGVTDFNLPDLRGYFLRGVSGTTGRDLDANDRVESAAGGHIKNNVGSVQSDAFLNHDHRIFSSSSSGRDPDTITGTGYVIRRAVDGQSYNMREGTEGNHPTHGQTSVRGQSAQETRPKNAYVYFIIKY